MDINCSEKEEMNDLIEKFKTLSRSEKAKTLEILQTSVLISLKLRKRKERIVLIMKHLKTRPSSFSQKGQRNQKEW